MEMIVRVESFHSVKPVMSQKAAREYTKKVIGNTTIDSLSLLEPTTSLPYTFTLEDLTHWIRYSSAFLVIYWMLG